MILTCKTVSYRYMPDSSASTIMCVSGNLIVADAYTVEGDVRKRIRVFKDPFVTSDRKFIRDDQRSCLGYAYNPMPVDKYNVTGIGSPWNKFFRRSVIVEHGLRFGSYVKGIFDDNLFTVHFLSVAGRASYVPSRCMITGSSRNPLRRTI